MEAFLHRFTPVMIQSVQTSQFHERKQRASEVVDSFAQELRWLFQKAYPSTSQGSKEAEDMGKLYLPPSLSHDFMRILRQNWLDVSVTWISCW